VWAEVRGEHSEFWWKLPARKVLGVLRTKRRIDPAFVEVEGIVEFIRHLLQGVNNLTKLWQRCGVTREHLSRRRSGKQSGHPTCGTFVDILDGIGVSLPLLPADDDAAASSSDANLRSSSQQRFSDESEPGCEATDRSPPKVEQGPEAGDVTRETGDVTVADPGDVTSDAGDVTVADPGDVTSDMGDVTGREWTEGDERSSGFLLAVERALKELDAEAIASPKKSSESGLTSDFRRYSSEAACDLAREAAADRGDVVSGSRDDESGWLRRGEPVIYNGEPGVYFRRRDIERHPRGPAVGVEDVARLLVTSLHDLAAMHFQARADDREAERRARAEEREALRRDRAEERQAQREFQAQMAKELARIEEKHELHRAQERRRADELSQVMMGLMGELHKTQRDLVKRQAEASSSSSEFTEFVKGVIIECATHYASTSTKGAE
jgi:DNA-binding phage protein